MLTGRDVTVVGAGIAGLAVARALALRGTRVRVLEQARAISEVGAGIQISPNGWRVIAGLGLGAAYDRIALRSHGAVLRNDAGAQVVRLRWPEGARFDLVHRADLIDILAEGAREAGAALELGARVLTTEDGLTLNGAALPPSDLVVAADGVRSPIRRVMLGETPPAFTGQTAYRALIPVAPGSVPAEAQVFLGPGRHLVAYPLRGGRLLNLVAVVEQRAWHDEGWTVPARPDDMRAAFAAFKGPVGDWLGEVRDTFQWGLFRRPVAPRWSGEGRVLIGDAAHPTLPFLAQGACLALEDAWCLTDALDRDWDRGLTNFEILRRKRAERVVAAATANARNFHLRYPLSRIAHFGLRAMDALTRRSSEKRYDWVYNYDALTATD